MLLIIAIVYFSVVKGLNIESQPTSTANYHNSSVVPQKANIENYQPAGDIQYRLTRLEVLLVEKLENLRAEVRESTRRLQALEWQSNEVHSTLEGFRGELNRVVESTVQSPSHRRHATVSTDPSLVPRVENLGRGVQTVAAATRVILADLASLKSNVSSLANQTRSLQHSTSHFVTKQFLNHGLLDLKHKFNSDMDTCSNSPSSHTPANVPENCEELMKTGKRRSGIYKIQPKESPKSFIVSCDMEIEGGGWTIIHQRFDGSQDFYKNWHDYKFGFGNLGGEFWLGLANIHHLTGNTVNEVLIDLQDFDFENRTARYNLFSVGSEVEGFPLKILAGYSGDAGDSLSYHAGSRFSTKDMDQDEWTEGSCAQAHGGGWWYRSCDRSNLNGKYLQGELPQQHIYQGMYWSEFRGVQYSLLRARMMVRPRREVDDLLEDIFTKKDAASFNEEDYD